MFKKPFLVIVVVCCFLPTVFAQMKQKLVFAKDGSGYYSTEGNNITFTELPKINKQTIAEATGSGDKKLDIRGLQVIEGSKKFLVFTNTKRVWRYETRGDYWLIDAETGKSKQIGIGQPPSSLMFAKVSPDGKKVAYVSRHNVYVEDIESGRTTALTKDGTSRLINGTFDWVYEEEFGCRDGFRWSPDSRSIAYWQIDARAIKNFLLINNTDSIYSYTVPVEYPKVGEDPSACRIGVVDLASGKTTWMKVPGDEKQHYIPRMEWVPNGGKLILQQLNRKQNESKIMVCDANTGAASTIYTETDNAWIDIKSRWNNDDPTGWEWVNNKNDFIWISEKDGWRHAWYVTLSGKEHLVTTEKADLISLKGIDAATGYIYYTASPNNATQQYLYRTKMDGKSKAELVTPAEYSGTSNYTISPDCKYAQYSFSNAATPPQTTWIGLPEHNYLGKKPTVNTNYRNIQFFQVATEDNVTMDGYMIKPKNFDSTKRYPVVVYLYGEPGAVTVTDSYGSQGNYLYGGDMASDGYIQVSIDNRGTPAPKGAAWRKSIYRKIGQLNIHDQAQAARKIMEWPFVDKERMAVWGWSGGGSTTLSLLFQYPDIYKTGISVAPVTNLLSYDNIYEERYMGVPQETREDYIKGSPITHAKKLKGNLLLIHGTGDDNVHYQNTEMLVNELIKHGKVFQMMSYPNRSHSMEEGEGTFMHLSKLYTQFLRQHCPPGAK